MSHVLISTYMRWFNKVLILSIFCCSHTEAAKALSQNKRPNNNVLNSKYWIISTILFIFVQWNFDIYKYILKWTDREMIGKQNLKRVAWFDWGVPFEPFHARVTQFSNPWGESTFSKKSYISLWGKKTSLIISLHCICTCSFRFSFFSPKMHVSHGIECYLLCKYGRF